MSEHNHGSGNKTLGLVVAGLGIALMLGTLPFYLASGLVAPLWAIVVLLMVWIALFLLGIRWFRRHPFWVIGLPVVAVAIWFGVLTAGEQLLGWTA